MGRGRRALRAGCLGSALILSSVAHAAAPAPPGWELAEDRQPGRTLFVLRRGEDTARVEVWREGRAGVCARGGLSVTAEGARPPEVGAWIDALCAGLPESAGDLIPRWTAQADGRRAAPGLPGPPRPPRPPGVATLGDHWPLRWMHLVVVAWWLSLAAVLPRWRGAWALGAGALAVRALADAPPVLMGLTYPEQRACEATGMLTTTTYGATWGAFMGLPWRLSGGHEAWLRIAQLGLSSLTVVALAGWVADRTDRRTGLTAGLLLAVSPLPVALASTETMFVLASLLQVTAIAGMDGARRGAGLCGALSVGLLAHLRPLQVVWVLVPLGLGAWRSQRAAVALGAALVAWRVAELADGGGQSLSGLARSEWSQLTRALEPAYALGAGGSLIWADPWRTPLAVTALAVAGLVASPPAARPLVLAAAAALAVTTATALPFRRPTDLLRFALPGAPFLAALAALPLGRWRPAPAAAAWCAIALSVGLARRPVGPRWTWVEERVVLEEALRHLGPDDDVVFDGRQDHSRFFEMWVNERGRGVWWHAGADGAPARAHRWVGRADAAAPGGGPRCDGAPVVGRAVPARGDTVERAVGDTVWVGLYPPGACREE